MLRRILLLTMALCTATSYSPVAAEGTSGPVLKWTSKNEKGLYGYVVYRSDSASGPFLRINSRIVAKKLEPEGNDKSSPLMSYEYVDESAERGKTYYYYIDAVADSGRKQKLTDVVRKKVPQ
ncbi:hypothetical protein [Dokdonella sp.]|uniref:hypothetical protein n=1 Tax=Dokdonella sp. TaxID=2291710 RepID=UPI003C623624